MISEAPASSFVGDAGAFFLFSLPPYHPPVAEPQTLLDWLAAKFPTSKRTTLRQMLQDGRVSLNGRIVVNAKAPVKVTDAVIVGDRPAPPKPSLEPLTLVFEDADLLVVDKPAGLLTSTNPREKRPTAIAIVTRYLAPDRKAKPGLIHRLDRDASGLVVFAKTQAAFDALKSQFFHHSVGRVYEAVVHGKPKDAEGVIDVPLVESAEGKVFVTKDAKKGQQAITHYRVVGPAALGTLLRVNLETGRKHQIRAHLASRGHPIVGDTMYGPQPPKSPTLFLRAIELDLDHPRTGKRMEFRAAPSMSS
jgi:RluA family pseudouridine synthase